MRAVDVVRVSGLGRDAAVERLSELADRHEVVDRALAERPEALLPGRGQGLHRAKQRGDAVPGIHLVTVERDRVAGVEHEILCRE